MKSKKSKKPDPYMMGTGGAQRAGSAIKQRHSRMESLMKEIKSDKTGPKRYR